MPTRTKHSRDTVVRIPTFGTVSRKPFAEKRLLRHGWHVGYKPRRAAQVKFRGRIGRPTMDSVPPEILAEIAVRLLSPLDLVHFRMVNRACAAAGFPSLVSHLRLINTHRCLHDAVDTLRSSPHGSLRATKSLTLYHGRWPSFMSWEDWKRHPLLINAADPETSDDQAYINHQHFAAEEILRGSETQLVEFGRLLHSFPNLQALTVSHLHAWRWGRLENPHYRSLRAKIRMVPIFEDFVGTVAFNMLLVASKTPTLSTLSIQGTFDMRAEWEFPLNRNIQSLAVSSLLVRDELETQMSNFLASFPNLTDLSIGVAPASRDRTLPLSLLKWGKLRQLAFANFSTSEDELLSFIERHKPQSMSLVSITLTVGSWQSFFRRLRQLNSAVQFHGAGVLQAENASACVLDPHSNLLIGLFLRTKDFPWPFGG